MINAPDLIRKRRLAAGLSQRQLARRAGTSPATLSRYESGLIDPTVGTLNRILAACSLRSRRWASLADLAPPIASSVDGPPPPTWRLVGEFLDDSKGASDEELLFSITEPPNPTGSDRADSLVAALAEYLCVRRGIIPPSWTQAPSEVRPWWFAAGPRFAGIAMRESPISFARRGIFITRGALERV